VTYLPYSNIPHALGADMDRRVLARSLRHAVADRARPDVIHAHRLFPTGAAALDLARDLGVPIVVTAHGSDVHTHPARIPAIGRITRNVVASADRLTAVSTYLADLMAGLATPRAPVRTVHLGVDTAHFRPMAGKAVLREQLGLPAAGVGFVSVCRISEAKGVYELVRAFREVADASADAWLVLVGDGPAGRDLEREIAVQGLADRVWLPGVVENERVPLWLNAADAFVLASHAEGLPNVVLEAMACGLPIVATTVGGTAEAVLPAVGELVPPGDEASLASAMVALATSAELRERRGAEGVTRIERHFTWSRVATECTDLYRELVGHARGEGGR
jgi:glycosyltransferase involved in cell wall biosynthesis